MCISKTPHVSWSALIFLADLHPQFRELTTATMEGEKLLEKLWREPTEENLQCLQCQKPFASGALIRTFRIEPPDSYGPGSSAVVSTSQGDIILFDRHIDCVVKCEIRFSAVSHVWDPKISKVQQQRKTVKETPEAAHRVLDIASNMYKGIQRPGYESRELWLDYVSVPQWSDALRSNILLIMHKIFSTAETTILYFDDVSPTVIEQLYNEKRSQERLKSVISVCNSKYFKRVWTAMEFIRSDRVRMMVSNYTYLLDLDDPAFLSQAFKAWNDEVKQHEKVHDVEKKVQMGKNQVPWSLGTLKEAKSLKRINFGMATALLCKRGCRDRMDFLHALRGIVRAKYFELLSSDFKTEYYRIAWECLKVGDFSPLLITPFMGAIEVRGPGHWSDFGYNDVFTWQLGRESRPPALMKDTLFNDVNQRLTIRVEDIGIVSTISKPDRASPMKNFSCAAKVALEIEGPDVKGFVEALGRMYPATASTTMEILEEKNEVNHLQRVLKKIYNTPEMSSWPMDGPDGIKWLADALSFSKLRPGASQTILGLNFAAYGTIHCSPFNYTVGITCMGCHKMLAHKVGSFVLPARLRSARAYRIPGLKYTCSKDNGVAILVRDDKIVGRMVWATPACACQRTETITLGLPDFFLPRAFSIN
ncbi:hypothetical protein FBEOM_1459 [Fusarium beomiforme]|uniref:Heterokaryon incompatibility domain-containing protein n=1 Tax=Fusarium beomiforme TaxID=44412 RepID=A0A9P5E113_9HYPO|nr:hypothetical protein FBEOM_1459 [Fusarium beomiforme]